MGYKASIRDKLIGIFVLIKVIPLMILAWFAWNEIFSLAETLETRVSEMAATSARTTKQVSDIATSSSIRALDVRSREAIERLTTDTARQIADFLYARDVDIRSVALLKPDHKSYRLYIDTNRRNITLHRPWVMDASEDAWVPREDPAAHPEEEVQARNKDNEMDFHYRPPEKQAIVKAIPIYLEMTFVDLSGKELIKVTTSDLMSPELRDVSDPSGTFCRAENYFPALRKLEPGQVYVSDVIGAYVKTDLIGTYSRKRAAEMGIEFRPEHSGYAGKENPVGKRFRGIVRWASPVVRDGKKIGYVTLALDHTHIMEFTDHIVPTAERYSAISDAGSGNYAFLWDHKGRNISHPRDYFIVGYDPETGQEAMPWLEKKYYDLYAESGLDVAAFLGKLPLFESQALSKTPSRELVRQGQVGLDCRFLNFAPQCDGWYNLTQYGGSGSFVIFWSGLKKLTTAAAVPYFTGQYGKSPRGFAVVTIGANVDEFHKPAVATARKLDRVKNEFLESIEAQNAENNTVIIQSLRNTATRLSIYTAAMIVLVILIAVLMASALTRKITSMIRGISRFQQGEMGYRLNITTKDEMGVLGKTFNEMADSIQQAMAELEQAKTSVEDSNVSLRALLSRIIDSMPSVIIGVDTKVDVTLWNGEAERMTGKTFARVEGQNLFDAFPLIRQKKAEILPAVLRGETCREIRLETRSGEETLFHDVTVYPLISEQVDGAVLRVDNVTTRVYMEEMMVQTEKMQSVGGLAAGMAHEINSPLAGIVQCAQVVRRRVETKLPANRKAADRIGLDLEKVDRYFEERSIYKMIQSIQDAGHRAAEIVAGMLAFSRKSDSRLTPCSIEKLLDQAVDIVKKDYDIKSDMDFKNIRIVKKYADALPRIPCDQGKMQQVFFNILKNGAHAMMENHLERDPVFEISVRCSGPWMEIGIGDNGPGMDEQVRNRVFEPFFTTRPVGVGTGLGLYVSYFIVAENHHGEISVDSVKGQGTRFVIRLPLVQASAAQS